MSRFAIVFLLFCLVLPTRSAAEPRFDAALFEHVVTRLMGDSAMGYAFVVADRNGIVGEAAGGWAQHPSDGNLRMSTTVPANWGSNQKVLSGIALIDLLERDPQPVAEQLEQKIFRFLPDRWQQVYFRGLTEVPKDWITIGDILDHTSGLAPEVASGGSAGTKIARGLAAPMRTVEFHLDQKRYNNNNYTLLLYMIPRIAYPEDVHEIELAAENLSLRDYNGFVAREYGKLYTRYMNERFLSRVPETTTATCRPGDLPANRYAKEYSGPEDTTGRTIDARHFCRSQGSWSYDARSMAHIWRAIEFGERIVEAESRALWPAEDTQSRLIYHRNLSHPAWTIRREGEVFRGHGGRSGNGSQSITVRLPWGHVGVGITNSGNIGFGRLNAVLLGAFYEATRTTGRRHVDLPGRDFRNFVSGNPDPKVCRDACDREARCRAWTYVAPGVQHPLGAMCWLKDSVPQQQRRTLVISGVK